ncbi:MAG TPA: ligase-associated DNA damage response endonuclease PdeM [Candidatus Polarisedimenticolaceae bacterium]
MPIEPRITIAGRRARLLPERALFLERGATLVVADVHLGKAAALRAEATAVPSGSTTADLDRLAASIRRTGARRLVILGDFLHARQGRQPRTLAAARAWRARHAGLEIVLVRGNHDRSAGDPPAELGFACVDGPFVEEGLAFVHEPETVRGAYALGGHLHPAVRLRGPARERARLAAFVFGRRVGVLPAFGSLTGTAVVAPCSGDRVYVVAGESVVKVGA